MNLLRAIGSMKFDAKYKISKSVYGIIYKAIYVANNKRYRFNHIFEIIFFVPLQIVKND